MKIFSKNYIYPFLSLIFFLLLWEYGHRVFGELLIPGVKDTFITVTQLLGDKETINEIFITIQRALAGFCIAISIGSFLGIIGGLNKINAGLVRPIISILMGMPPIAWVVLAMIWFGFGNTTVIFTVVVATIPLSFIAAFQGIKTIDRQIIQMADSYNLSQKNKLKHIYLPHLVSYLFTAWISTLMVAWKIVIMAELVSSNIGVGALLADSRANLDSKTTIALVFIMVGLLMILEYLIFDPLKKRFELWRT